MDARFFLVLVRVMINLMKYSPRAFGIAIGVTAIWTLIYFFFIFPSYNINDVCLNFIYLAKNHDFACEVTNQFILHYKIIQIMAFVIFDCSLLYLLKKKDMPSIWKNFLWITCAIVILSGCIITFLSLKTARIPENQADPNWIEFLASNNTIIFALQASFFFTVLNRFCLYIPKFSRIKKVNSVVN